jgi:hypothetical protein
MDGSVYLAVKVTMQKIKNRWRESWLSLLVFPFVAIPLVIVFGEDNLVLISLLYSSLFFGMGARVWSSICPACGERFFLEGLSVNFFRTTCTLCSASMYADQ